MVNIEVSTRTRTVGTFNVKMRIPLGLCPLLGLASVGREQSPSVSVPGRSVPRDVAKTKAVVSVQDEFYVYLFLKLILQLLDMVELFIKPLKHYRRLLLYFYSVYSRQGSSSSVHPSFPSFRGLGLLLCHQSLTILPLLHDPSSFLSRQTIEVALSPLVFFFFFEVSWSS